MHINVQMMNFRPRWLFRLLPAQSHAPVAQFLLEASHVNAHFGIMRAVSGMPIPVIQQAEIFVQIRLTLDFIRQPDVLLEGPMTEPDVVPVTGPRLLSSIV
jgi:hypothetical protein